MLFPQCWFIYWNMAYLHDFHLQYVLCSILCLGILHCVLMKIKEYGLNISVQKTKSMTFKGWDLLRTKTVIDGKIIEQVNLFNYLGNMVSYEGELDIDNKLNNCFKITGILNSVFRQKAPWENKNKTIQHASPSSLVIWQWNLDY